MRISLEGNAREQDGVGAEREHYVDREEDTKRPLQSQDTDCKSPGDYHGQSCSFPGGVKTWPKEPLLDFDFLRSDYLRNDNNLRNDPLWPMFQHNSISTWPSAALNLARVQEACFVSMTSYGTELINILTSSSPPEAMNTFAKSTKTTSPTAST